jgi:hypothetical protein
MGVKMKKASFLIIFSMLLLSVQVMAQTGPIMGYDLVPWGTSVADVRRAYNIGDDIRIRPAQDDPNVGQLVQINVSDAIEFRSFMFNGDKLYRVVVSYKDTSDNTVQNLLSIIENRFGRRTDYDIKRGTATVAFQQLNYAEETSTFGTYSPNLVVELLHRVYYAGLEKDTNNLLGQNYLFVQYTWKKFRDEYQASRLGL